MASSSGSSGLDPMVSLFLSQLSAEQKTQLASFIQSPASASDPETRSVTGMPRSSPSPSPGKMSYPSGHHSSARKLIMVRYHPCVCLRSQVPMKGLHQSRPTPTQGLDSSGKDLETPCSVSAIRKVASPGSVPEPSNQSMSTGEPEGEKAGSSLQERQESPEGTMLEARPTVELKPTSVNSLGSRILPSGKSYID